MRLDGITTRLASRAFALAFIVAVIYSNA
jgi:hypothetical protein